MPLRRMHGASLLPDQSLADLLPSPSATEWQRTRICPECSSPVDSRECSTLVCMTCKQSMSRAPSSADVRSVVRGGRWVRQQHRDGTSLLQFKPGRWVSPTHYDFSMNPERD